MGKRYTNVKEMYIKHGLPYTIGFSMLKCNMSTNNLESKHLLFAPLLSVDLKEASVGSQRLPERLFLTTQMVPEIPLDFFRSSSA